MYFNYEQALKLMKEDTLVSCLDAGKSDYYCYENGEVYGLSSCCDEKESIDFEEREKLENSDMWYKC